MLHRGQLSNAFPSQKTHPSPEEHAVYISPLWDVTSAHWVPSNIATFLERGISEASQIVALEGSGDLLEPGEQGHQLHHKHSQGNVPNNSPARQVLLRAPSACLRLGVVRLGAAQTLSAPEGAQRCVVSLTRFWCWNSPPAPTSRTPFLPQPQVLPLQNLANPTPVPAAPRRSLTLARDKEKQDPEGHGSQPLAKSVQLHLGLTGLFCTTGGHAAFHQKAAQGRIQPSTIECLAQASGLWTGKGVGGERWVWQESGTERDTLNPTPCLSLSPPPVKIEVTVLYPLDKHLKNVFRAARWEPGEHSQAQGAAGAADGSLVPQPWPAPSGTLPVRTRNPFSVSLLERSAFSRIRVESARRKPLHPNRKRHTGRAACPSRYPVATPRHAPFLFPGNAP
eukprot:bmy_05289T0